MRSNKSRYFSLVVNEIMWAKINSSSVFTSKGIRLCMLSSRRSISKRSMKQSTFFVFLGYSTLHKGYRSFDPSASRLYISGHVILDEHCFQKQVDFPTSPISTTVPSILPMPLILLISSSSSAPTTDSSVDLSSEPSLSSASDSSAGNHTSPASANSPVDHTSYSFILTTSFFLFSLFENNGNQVTLL